MRASTHRRAGFSFRSRSGVLPLLSLLACAGDEAGLSGNPARGSAAAAPLLVQASAQDPGLSRTVPVPATAQGEDTPPAEPGATEAEGEESALDEEHTALERYDGADGAEAGDGADGAEADEGEANVGPQGQEPPAEDPSAQEPRPDDGTPSDGASDEPPTPVDEGSGAAGAGGDGGSAGAESAPQPEDDSGEEEGDEDEDEDDGDGDGEGDEEEVEEEEPPPLKPSFHLAIIGSSTAAGEGASSASYAWVELLAGSLRGVSAFSVSNFAVGGYTSVELLPASRKSGNIEEAIIDRPDLILVALAGSNDLAAGTSSATFLERLMTLRDTARAAGIPTFFMSTAPKDISESERVSLADWASVMQGSFQSCWVPGGDGVHAPCFVDLFSVLASRSLGLLPQYSSGDGIHLNDAGHSVVFGQVEAVIRPYVCGVTSCR